VAKATISSYSITPTLIFGWYLPQACVVLHIAHQYISEQKYELIDAEERTTSLEFAKPDGNADVGAIAASILHKSLAFKTRRWLKSHLLTANGADRTSACLPLSPSTTKPSAYEDFHFKHTIERLWYFLDAVGSTLKMNRSEYTKCFEIPIDSGLIFPFANSVLVCGREQLPL
jgi:hypothetical protein